MDLSLLYTDDQTRSLPALKNSQTDKLDPFSLLQSPIENMLSAYETGAEAVLDVSDPEGKSPEPLSNVSKSLSKEKSPNSECLKPSSSSFNMSECLPLCSEPAPKDDDFRVCSYFGSSEPVLPFLPVFSHDLISPLSESFSEFHAKQEPALSFSILQYNSTPQPFRDMSSTCEGSTEPSVTEPLSSSEHSLATCLLRSLSHQDSLETDTAIAPVSDLYIFESDTQDFILSPNVDPQEAQCTEYKTLSQTEGEKAEPDCDTHVLICDSHNAVTQCHGGTSEERDMVAYESDVSQHAKRRPPAVDACEAGLMSVNDGRRGKAEVTDLTHQARRSDSPIDQWLDACQYLAGETQVSGYIPDGSEGIGWSSDDTRGWGPPVERWSSVDSWASALSDWTAILESPPKDFTAAFTEIGAGIDALTQALAEVNTYIETEASKEEKGVESAVRARSQPPMGIQDQPIEAQNIPESSVLSGQRCLSLYEAAGPELRDREGSQSVESLCDSTDTTEEEKKLEEIQSCQAERSPYPSHQHSSMGSPGATLASPGGYSVDVIPGSTSSADLDLSHFSGFDESDIFISNEEDPVILNIIEDADLEAQTKPRELIIEEPFRDEVCEVTDEHIVSQPGSAVEQRVNSVPDEVNREETEPSTDLHFLTKHTLTNTHLPGVHKQPGLHVNVHKQVSSDTLPDLDGACQVEPQFGSPTFIMPLAPLDIRSSLVYRTSCNLDGDQTCTKRSLNDNTDFSCDHVQPCILWPTLDGITDKTSLCGDELIHRKCTIKSAEKSLPQGQPERKTIIEEIHDLSRELSHLADVPADHFVVSQRNHIAFITLDLNDPFVSRAAKPIATAIQSELNQKTAEKMPHKTHKSTSESKARSKKDKTTGHHHGVQVSKKQENSSHHVSPQQVCKQQDIHPLTEENHTSENIQVGLEDKEAKLVIETIIPTEKAPNKPHVKKKKKHAQNATGVKSVGEPLVEVENGTKSKTAKGRIDMFEAKLGAKAGIAQNDSDQSDEKKSQQPEAKVKASQGEQPPRHADHKDHHPKNVATPLNDDIIKRRRLSDNKFGKIVSALESKVPKPSISIKAKAEEPKVEAGATRKKAFSEVVKQKIPPKEDPKVVQPIQAVSVSGDPQTLCLWCQFAAVFSNCTVTWRREDTVLSESKRSAGDESRVSLNICSASQKDLGMYQCQLTSAHGSVTLDYLLTYEVLSEIVIPPSPKTISSASVDVGSEEEDVNCSRLIFKEDFLSQQYFGENQPLSIITEKVHFGEGMHRQAFRTKMQAGQITFLLPGHSCVLKVHSSISYGTKNNDELVHRNFTLAVEECHVQNTAREYIKAYTAAAQSVEAFGEIPEIIPIYLVHRPSNDIPYATLEQELIGDFVKYSVKDGKEINLMRRESEAGQKCCAFQHWVYHKTEGNLLVTDMQGVGMRLTDVGIATCKKGYKGFKGNCATSFIDQFKALHQCNTYCEILGLKSLQPKPKKPASAPKAKPQPSAAPKKKACGPTVKGKS
ncbi:alpha-protein kinase 2 isoform X2 [Cottoperca gobio]|uniref:non-specific serine/threonine protein kinase n=1 Tax=Cottoperca gobio TaxID=56716 RepID=A0A6J2QUF1_COTGO|nr:alpha-protein kinase 2 isoform X2 [Cottoperca gobio]